MAADVSGFGAAEESSVKTPSSVHVRTGMKRLIEKAVARMWSSGFWTCFEMDRLMWRIFWRWVGQRSVVSGGMLTM